MQKKIREWAQILGCQVGCGSLHYLGAELGISHRKVEYWQPLVKKVQRKLGAWNTDNISMVGRLVLLRAALDSIPSYWFGLFRIPQTIILQLEQIRRNFLWGDKLNLGCHSRKIHLLKWESVCKSKNQGCLGISSLRAKNLALLSKWW